MTTWRELVGGALAGAERQQHDERTLLRQAAEQSLKRLAAWIPPTGAPPGWEVCPPEPLQIAPHGCLGQLVDDSDVLLLSEWLSLAAERRLVAPPMQLAALLRRASGNTALQEAVQPVLGERGRWLAGLNPDWSFAQALDPTDAWSSGRRADRLRGLTELRARDPAAARQLLADSWPRESGEMRASMLRTLSLNLSPDDEPFLEAALVETRKEVREIARDLLAELPNSPLAIRMRNRAHAYVEFKKGFLGGKIEVSPPEAVDPELVADIVDAKPWPGTGARAWLLAQVVSLVPPTEWPLDILGPAVGSEWSDALWRGLIGAAARFRDARWTQALLAQSRTPKAPQQPSPLEAFRVLPPPAREAIMLKFLADPNLAPALIESANHYWSATLSQTIARTLSVTIAVLPRLAYSIDPSVLPDLEQWLEAHVGQTPAIDAPMKRTLRTLRFRARMRGELLHT